MPLQRPQQRQHLQLQLLRKQALQALPNQVQAHPHLLQQVVGQQHLLLMRQPTMLGPLPQLIRQAAPQKAQQHQRQKQLRRPKKATQRCAVELHCRSTLPCPS